MAEQRSKRSASGAPAPNGQLTVKRKDGHIWSHVKHKWRVETPEERVRQEYLCTLVNEYGYSLDQIDEEVTVTGRGSGQARADFLIWRSAQDRRSNRKAMIVVECKADNVTIDQKTYKQGANYSQYEQAKFFVTHNNRETKYWKVDLQRRAPNFQEIENIPTADATDKEIEAILSKLKEFKEDEFADLLHQCHNVIRNREKKDPAAAFDEIAKILFVKVWVEREMRRKRQRQNLFTVEFLDSQLGDNPLDVLFQQTKEFYKADRIFKDDDRINLKPATGREIVRRLERYNLSATSEDIKGIAFERFLGRTFRGEIGQFFTPRSIVEFMIRMMEPKEGDIICDPASGSGGFLIRFFEIVREQILADIDSKYQKYSKDLDGQNLPEKKKAELLNKRYEELQEEIRQDRKGSRLWKLANRCIYGTDANDRMARTSKMNMIMHGDGHGGVHHHDGFINVNGIFEERFDIVLTNPPFGANVEPSDVILETDVSVPYEEERRYEDEYGELYREALARVRANVNEPIAKLFELPKGENGKVKTEILFIERCLSLLKPGGKLGIVLPEGVLNNPSLAYVREFCEDRAFISAVVSLPQETFYSSQASVKASLLFMQKFDEREKAEFDRKKKVAEAEVDAKYASEIEAETARLQDEIDRAKELNIKVAVQDARKELRDYLKRMEAMKKTEVRALLKERFPYPIFLYEAEKVGITATGEDDQNELYPNKNVPPDTNKTCLELYREFRKNSEGFFIQEATE